MWSLNAKLIMTTKIEIITIVRRSIAYISTESIFIITIIKKFIVSLPFVTETRGLACLVSTDLF